MMGRLSGETALAGAWIVALAASLSVLFIGVVLGLAGGAVALWHLGLYIGVIPEPIQPCTATGPSCTDDNQLILGVPIPLLSAIAFALVAALSAASLKETRS